MERLASTLGCDGAGWPSSSAAYLSGMGEGSGVAAPSLRGDEAP